ncbi:hypothetical protein [Zhenhengia sp.]|uniref:hypothetical protein n=1 Tax=Zhenhengia sp. TaxID=2944208 RepID=UPI0030792D70
MKKQKVIRTKARQGVTLHENEPYELLAELLEEGYKVVMCNPIGNELEYILEKEDQQQAHVVNVKYEVIPGAIAQKLYDEILNTISKERIIK